MIKRLVWLTFGIVVGAYTVLRAQRSLRRRAGRLKPESMANDLASAIRHLGVDLRKAVEEGRSAMAVREAELQEQLNTRTGV